MRKDMKKLYIIGSVASGKTTTAKKLSKQFSIPYYELDSVVHAKGKNTRIGNVKRSTIEIDMIFNGIIESQSWIIEDSLRKCFIKGLDKADTIIWLDIPYPVIRIRIFTRWIKQVLNIESCNYKPTISMLSNMIKWSRDFYKDKQKFINILQTHSNKLIKVKSCRQLRLLLAEKAY